NRADQAVSLAVSPDGSKVIVTGHSCGIRVGGYSCFDYATLAYDATTGAQLWVSRYDASGRQDDAHTVKVSPDGTKVFVTGLSVGTSGYSGYATVAYDATTGAQLWESRYEGLGIGADARTPYVGAAGSREFGGGTCIEGATRQGSAASPDTSGSYDGPTSGSRDATGCQL